MGKGGLLLLGDVSARAVYLLVTRANAMGQQSALKTSNYVGEAGQ
jgi:hypothetical protein